MVGLAATCTGNPCRRASAAVCSPMHTARIMAKLFPLQKLDKSLYRGDAGEYSQIAGKKRGWPGRWTQGFVERYFTKGNPGLFQDLCQQRGAFFGSGQQKAFPRLHGPCQGIAEILRIKTGRDYIRQKAPFGKGIPRSGTNHPKPQVGQRPPVAARLQQGVKKEVDPRGAGPRQSSGYRPENG